MQVGFIGIGTMGGGMAANIRKAGYALMVHDVRREIGKPLEEAGAVWAGTVGDIGRACDVVFTSLPGPAEVERIALWHAMRQGMTGRRRTFDGVGEQFLQNKYEPAAFALRLAHKDMSLALELAHDCEVPMPMAERAYEDFTAALERGWGSEDSRSPMRLQLERAGVKIEESSDDVRRTLGRD